MALTSVNPTTGETIAQYPETDPKTVETAVGEAHRAFLNWREADYSERAPVLERAAHLLAEDREPLARLMALEMGKPLRQGRAEVEKCATACAFYARHAPAFLAPDPIPTEASRSFVSFRPLGTILAIMPWNFPLWQVFRFAAPALMAGNAALLKHAGNVSGCALAIEDIFGRAGAPRGLFRTLLLPGSRALAVLDHPQVAAVTVTGSTEAGRAVAAAAGRVLKKSVLELGGSDPYLVLEDADLVAAASVCADARLVNSGQSCIAGKRFIVVNAVGRAFREKFVQAMKEKIVGDPLDERTDVGPLARRDLREDLHAQVRTSIERGARVLLGAELPDGPGAFYPPSVLDEVVPGMPAYEEELFGPVAAVISAAGEPEALRAANDSVFGLGAAVFTRDAARGERLAERALDAGSCFVNASVRSDPRLPFGGIKASGYGRELSAFGIREFVNIKTVYVA